MIFSLRANYRKLGNSNLAIIIRQTTILINNYIICAGSLKAILYATNPILIILLLINITVLYTVEFDSNIRLYNVNNINVNSYCTMLSGSSSPNFDDNLLINLHLSPPAKLPTLVSVASAT